MSTPTPTPLVDLALQCYALKAAMVKPKYRVVLGKLCRAEDFLGPDRDVFNALAEMGLRNDMVALERLPQAAKDRLREFDREYRDTPDPLSFEEYVHKVVDLSERRGLVAVLELGAKRLHGEEPTDAITGDLVQGMMEVRARTAGDTLIPMHTAVSRVRELIKRWQAGEDGETVPTGWADIDRILGGMVRKHITTLGGRPGQGKTQVALQIARNVALWARGQKRDSSVVIFSAEMTVERLVLRLASSATGISARSIRQNKASEQEAKAYMAALEQMVGLPIKVDETPNPTTQQMLDRVAGEAMQHKDGVDLVVFDYLELAGDDNDEREDARLGDVMRGLKKIAKRFNCPVLVLSQLNRKVEDRATRMPELSDLRASGWVEALSQQVIFLMRPDSYGSKDPKTGVWTYENGTIKEMAIRLKEGAAILKIAKNRDEETGTVIMRFKPGSTQFIEEKDAAAKPSNGAKPAPTAPPPEADEDLDETLDMARMPGRDY